jgi:hypothetical protein
VLSRKSSCHRDKIVAGLRAARPADSAYKTGELLPRQRVLAPAVGRRRSGRVTDIATSLLTATDGILGTQPLGEPRKADVAVAVVIGDAYLGR